MPIEWFVTTLIDWTIFLVTRTKLASVGFVAARNCMRQQVLGDAKSLPITVAGGSPQRHATSYALNSARYHSIIHSTTPVLLQYYKVLLQYYKGLQRTTPYYKVLLQYYSVPQSTTPVLLCTTKYYSVLQSTTSVLICTTKRYSSTTLYHKVLPLYYSVPQSTTPYYFSTNLYYKALLQYYSVLQSTTPVILLEDSITWRFYHLTILLLGGSSPFTATSACSDMCPDYSLEMWPNECNVQHVKMISPLFPAL